MFRILSILVLIVFLFSNPGMAADESEVTKVQPVQLNISPANIDVGTFYNGAEVEVSAEIPDCDGAVLVIEKGSEEITLNRKGRVAGIWLNVAQITVRNAPRVYILAASGKLEDFSSPEKDRELGLGIEYLRDKIQFTCDKPLGGTEFDDFFKLKTDNGTYMMDVPVNLEPSGPDQLKLTTVLPLAPTIPPGTYELSLYCFDKNISAKYGQGQFKIVRTGLARRLAELAYDHPAYYGILAIVVAMLVGIIMGIIFNSRPGSGH